MARQVRIQYAGALYHVMARGDRREAIFRDGHDRAVFLDGLDEACGRTGWLCQAYALLDNHYHLLIQTPEPNLVAGMSWLQTTYTRRHNVRHRLWGHLFGGRYKAVLVDDEDATYFAALVDYIHLNPGRAGLAPAGKGLEAYPWSSLGYYLEPPRRRKPWQQAERGLASWGWEDNAAGRRAYLAHLEERLAGEGAEAGRALPEGQSLHSTLSRGWFFGREAFREKLLALARPSLKTRRKSAAYRGADAVKLHELERAEALVRAGLELCGLDSVALRALARGDERKALIALVVKRQTTAPLDWIAQRLEMGARSTVSRETGEIARRLADDRELAKLYRCIGDSELLES